MKKTSICMLIIAVLTGICFSAYAETNMDYHISNVELLQGDEYSRNTKADVYGFEEANNVSLRVGELKNPDNELVEKISEYKTQNDNFFFVELTAFDTEQSSKISLSDKRNMQVTFSKNSLSSGFSGSMGKDYKLLRIGDNVRELTVKSSSLYDVTFETDELGIFAVIYDPKAITLTFMSDSETIYHSLHNLTQNSIITFPDNPQKNGFRFAGWYQRENGEGLRLYPGIKLNEVANSDVYAYWVEDNEEHSASSTNLKNVNFDTEIICEVKNNQHIYFIPEAKGLSEITVTVEPENPYSYVYFGYSIDNIGEINSYSQTDLTYAINNSSVAKESRMIVKVVSEDLKNEAMYSFIFSEENPSFKIYPIDDAEHSGTLQANISGMDSFVLSDEYSSAELKIGEITNPGDDLKAVASDLTLENDTVKFFDLLAYNNETVISSDFTANVKVNLYRPIPAQMGERYEIYRIDGNELIPQNILSSDTGNVFFEADKAGRFLLVYGDNVYSAKFISDGEEYRFYDKLKLGTTTPTPEQPSKNGYTFIGWFTNENGTGSKLENDAIISGNSVYYAYWKKNSSGGGSSVTRYTVKFNTNGGSTVTSQTVKKNNKATEPTEPTKDGYNFYGWYTDSEFTTEYDFDTKVTKNITLYAKWVEDEAQNPSDDKKDDTNDKKDDNSDNTDDNKPTTDDWKNPFTDVTSADWFFDNVRYANENGLMSGTTDTTFAPNDNLTRGMLVTVLYRAEGEPAVNKGIPFADVTASQYYANAVIWAEQNGIVNGVSETEFAPDENITREQIATIIYRYAEYKGIAPTGAWAIKLDYADVADISDYAVEGVMYCTMKNIMQGKDNNMFAPKDNATRAEIAAILNRFIESNK